MADQCGACVATVSVDLPGCDRFDGVRAVAQNRIGEAAIDACAKLGSGIQPFPEAEMHVARSSALPPSRKNASGKVAELDGIRGIAILLVILFHFGRYIPDQTTWANYLYRGFKGLGWTGVDLFFVLSGYLITGILLRTRRSKNYFTSFYMRRALRILPLYYIGVFVFFDCGISRMARWYQVAPLEQFWYWLPVSNWHSGFGTLANSPIGHMWSLAVEEQFYLIWPWVVLFLSESVLLALCLALIAGSGLVRCLPALQAMQRSHPEFLYRLTPFRIDPILWGAVVAVLSRRPWFAGAARRWAPVAFVTGVSGVAAASIQAGVTQYASEPMTMFGYSFLGVACASVLAYGVTTAGSGNLAAMALRNPLFTEFGKYSYAIYIFQTPISYLAPIGSVLAGLGLRNGAAVSVVSVVIGAALSFAAARCSWAVIEQPFLRLKGRFAPI